MSSIKKNIIQTSKAVILALILVLGVNYAFAIEWMPPLSNPPGGQTSAPLNVSQYGQAKDGGLILNLSGTAPYGLKVMKSGQSQTGFSVLNNGRVGIGTDDPQASLDIFGNIKIRGGTPGLGKVLTSDADGVGTWQPASGGSGGGVSGGTVNRVPKFSSATTLTNSEISEIIDSGVKKVGIGTDAPLTKLDVNGNIRIQGDGGLSSSPGAGKVLTSTANGTGVWRNYGPVSPTQNQQFLLNINVNSSDPQDLLCPPNTVMTGLRLTDWDENSNPTGMRVRGIYCYGPQP